MEIQSKWDILKWRLVQELRNDIYESSVPNSVEHSDPAIKELQKVLSWMGQLEEKEESCD